MGLMLLNLYKKTTNDMNSRNVWITINIIIIIIIIIVVDASWLEYWLMLVILGELSVLLSHSPRLVFE